jgi:hypothetical protein
MRVELGWGHDAQGKGGAGSKPVSVTNLYLGQ